MVTFTEALERIKGQLWKPLHINMNKLDDDYDPEDEPRYSSAFLFDIRDDEEGTLGSMLEDAFGDGQPDNLDFETKVPFGVISGLYAEDEVEYGKGKFEAIQQMDQLFFVDIENGEANKVPVYVIDIDGTAIVETFRKIADDISELDFKTGFAPEED